MLTLPPSHIKGVPLNLQASVKAVLFASLHFIPSTYTPNSFQLTRVFIGLFPFLQLTHKNMGDRDSLVSREIPFMKLSDGSPSSLTGPPQPLPAPYYTMADGRAVARFAVEGNVVST